MCGSGRAVCGDQSRSEPPFSYPYKPEDGREQLQAPDDISRVVRGGAFWYAPRNARCAYRVRLRRARRLQLPRLSRGGAPMPLISDPLVSGSLASGGVQRGSPPLAARRAAAAGLTTWGQEYILRPARFPYDCPRQSVSGRRSSPQLWAILKIVSMQNSFMKDC